MIQTDLLGGLATRAKKFSKPPRNEGKEIREPKWRAIRKYPMATFSTRDEVQNHLVRLKELSEERSQHATSKSYSSLIREAVVRFGELPEEEIVRRVGEEYERRGDGSVQQNRYPYISTPDHKGRLRWLKKSLGARSYSEIIRAAIIALEEPDLTRRF